MSESLLRLDSYEDFPLFVAAMQIGEGEREAAGIDDKGSQAFLDNNPEWDLHYRSKENAALLIGQCTSHIVPMTRLNLEVFFKQLKDSGQLKYFEAPPSAAPEVDNSRGIIQQVGDALAHYVPGDDETTTLEKLRDDSTLSDHARKLRDKKLALLAGKQRREFADSHPLGDESRLVI